MPTGFMPVLWLLLLLQACSQTPRVAAPAITSVDQEPLPNNWVIKAKLGIRNGSDSGSVTLNWQQHQNRYTIRLQGALGQGSAVVYGNDQFIVIERPGESPLYSEDVKGLLEKVFGWDLPIHDFSFWVLGAANPNQPVTQASYGPSGTLTVLEQSQWTLTYSRYETVEQWQLPKRIRAKQADSQITLIIREWQIR